jgi:site-specific DNA recombinase
MISACQRYIGYVRVSTEEQAQTGVSLDAQRDKISMFVKLHGLDLVGMASDEGVSAGSLDRPALTEALASLDAREACGLIVAKLDRLTRNVRDLGNLIDRYFGANVGHNLVSVDGSIDTRSASGRMVLNVLTSTSQWELETIRERTQAAMDHKRSKGEVIGTVPYGFTREPGSNRLVFSLEENETIEVIHKLHVLGLSLRTIAAHLTGLGRPTKRGRPWAASTIRELLKRAPVS